MLPDGSDIVDNDSISAEPFIVSSTKARQDFGTESTAKAILAGEGYAHVQAIFKGSVAGIDDIDIEATSLERPDEQVDIFDVLQRGVVGDYSVTFRSGSAHKSVVVVVYPDYFTLSEDGKSAIYAKNITLKQTEAKRLADSSERVSATAQSELYKKHMFRANSLPGHAVEGAHLQGLIRNSAQSLTTLITQDFEGGNTSALNNIQSGIPGIYNVAYKVGADGAKIDATVAVIEDESDQEGELEGTVSVYAASKSIKEADIKAMSWQDMYGALEVFGTKNSRSVNLPGADDQYDSYRIDGINYQVEGFSSWSEFASQQSLLLPDGSARTYNVVFTLDNKLEGTSHAVAEKTVQLVVLPNDSEVVDGISIFAKNTIVKSAEGAQLTPRTLIGDNFNRLSATMANVAYAQGAITDLFDANTLRSSLSEGGLHAPFMANIQAGQRGSYNVIYTLLPPTGPSASIDKNIYVVSNRALLDEQRNFAIDGHNAVRRSN